MNRSLFLKNLEKDFCNLTYKKTNFVKHIKIFGNIYRKNLSAIVYRLPILLQEIEIYRSSLSPTAFLKLSIIVIAHGFFLNYRLSLSLQYKKVYPAQHWSRASYQNHTETTVIVYCIKNKSKHIQLRTTTTTVYSKHCSLARYRCRAEKHSSQEIFRLEEIFWYLVCMSLSLVGWIEKAARSASVFFFKAF